MNPILPAVLVSTLAWIAPGPLMGVEAVGDREDLTLDQALEMAERLHPLLAEARARVDAAAGRAQQAGALPNPEAVVGAQQLPLDRAGSNQREYVAGIAQTMPLGGRLRRAREAEELEREVRARGLDVVQRDLRRRVHSAFATALYQGQAYQVRNQLAEDAGRAVNITRALIEAGDAVPGDLARVEMELALARMELARSETMRQHSLKALAAAIGDVRLEVKSLSGSLEAVFEVPTLEELAANLSAQPERLLADAAVRAGRARIDLARAEQVPDVRVEALYHRLEATRENTFDIGLSIPLPLFNRQQGRLREARAETAAAEARARSTENELRLRLHDAHARLVTALAAGRALKTEILPRAATVLEAAEARHAAGDISLNEVLPARRDWAHAQLAHLESLRDVMQAWAELRSLASPD